MKHLSLNNKTNLTLKLRTPVDLGDKNNCVCGIDAAGGIITTLSERARHVEQVSYGENKLLQGFLLQGLRQPSYLLPPPPYPPLMSLK